MAGFCHFFFCHREADAPLPSWLHLMPLSSISCWICCDNFSTCKSIIFLAEVCNLTHPIFTYPRWYWFHLVSRAGKTQLTWPSGSHQILSFGKNFVIWRRKHTNPRGKSSYLQLWFLGNKHFPGPVDLYTIRYILISLNRFIRFVCKSKQ